MFCPGARSTNILATRARVLAQLAAEGKMVDPGRLNVTMPVSGAPARSAVRAWALALVLGLMAVGSW